MTKEELRRQVVIIGSGPAGLTAAIYTARANLSPLLIDAPADTEKQTTPGGQLMITTDVENYPGFAKGIEGPELMMQFRQQAERFGTEFLEEWINTVELQERPFTLHTDTKIIKTETLISLRARRRNGWDSGDEDAIGPGGKCVGVPLVMALAGFCETSGWWSWAAAIRRWKSYVS